MSDLPVIDVVAKHQQAFAIVQGQLSPGNCPCPARPLAFCAIGRTKSTI
jgi:hypothetical protein